MHRSLFIAAFVLVLASAPLLAQHGGGHASGGMGGHAGGFSSHGSFGGGHMGGSGFGGAHSYSGTRAYSGPRSGSAFAPRAYSYSRGAASRGSLYSRGRNNSGVGLRLRTYGHGRNCGVYGCGWGYGYPYLWGGVDPYWWNDFDSSDDGGDQQYGPPQYDNGLANEMEQQGLPPRRMPDSGQGSYSRPHEERTQAMPATVLVFRDQHKEEVRNYAIVGQTLWNFSQQRTEKIPLSDLDIPATTKANDDRGVDFRLPGAREGQ